MPEIATPVTVYVLLYVWGDSGPLMSVHASEAGATARAVYLVGTIGEDMGFEFEAPAEDWQDRIIELQDGYGVNRASMSIHPREIKE